jgi:tetratricopeptide (TPR) repeat protein
LQAQGRRREALLHLQVALCFKPEIQTQLSVALLLYQTGDFRRAVAQFRQVLSLKPDHAEALNNLAWILATCPADEVRDGVEAVRCAERACRLTAFKQAAMVGTLAAAYAEAGRFPEAVATAETAVKLALAANDSQFAAVNQQLLMLYRAGKPWHEKLAVNPGP